MNHQKYWLPKSKEAMIILINWWTKKLIDQRIARKVSFLKWMMKLFLNIPSTKIDDLYSFIYRDSVI